MNLSRLVRLGVMSVGVLAGAPAAVAQPSLENFRFDPPRVCARGTFRWEVSYRGLPGGLAAAKEVSMEGRWDGPGERSGRSRLTPARDDLQLYTAEQGRFESRLVQLLPERTLVFAGIPNYGEALADAHRLFEERLRESPVLQGFWQEADPARHGGPDVATVIADTLGHRLTVTFKSGWVKGIVPLGDGRNGAETENLKGVPR